MSDIDLIKHCRLGQFIDLPIYQCLENGCWLGKSNKLEPSSVAEKDDLCIGGGSGEHPAMVIKSVEYCVANYLSEWEIKDSRIKKELAKNIDKILNYLGWSTKDKKIFFKKNRLLSVSKKGEELNFLNSYNKCTTSVSG